MNVLWFSLPWASTSSHTLPLNITQEYDYSDPLGGPRSYTYCSLWKGPRKLWSSPRSLVLVKLFCKTIFLYVFFFCFGALICYKVCNVLTPESVAPGALQDSPGVIRNYVHSAQSLNTSLVFSLWLVSPSLLYDVLFHRIAGPLALCTRWWDVFVHMKDDVYCQPVPFQ